MATEIKRGSAAAEFKAFDGEKGIVEMFVSVFDNVDDRGDVVRATAFDRTLAEWAARGDPVPAIWSHQWDNPFAHIGAVLEIGARTVGDKAGLWAQLQLDMAKDYARQVYDLLRARRVTQASFAYAVKAYQFIEVDGREVRELTDLELFEVGPTLVGMNQETELLQVASHDGEAPRAPEKKDDAPADEADEADQTGAGDVDPTLTARAVELLTRTRNGGR
jgi:hypothetical protein